MAGQERLSLPAISNKNSQMIEPSIYYEDDFLQEEAPEEDTIEIDNRAELTAETALTKYQAQVRSQVQRDIQ